MLKAGVWIYSKDKDKSPGELWAGDGLDVRSALWLISNELFFKKKKAENQIQTGNI